MDAGFFDVLHHTADEHLTGLVANRINVDFGRILQEAIDEHRTAGRQPALATERAEALHLRHCLREFGVVVHDAHRSTTKHVTGSHEHRITGLRRHRTRTCEVGGCRSGWLRNAESVAQRIPLFAVFGDIDRRGRRAGHQVTRNRASQLERGLATERHDHSRFLAGRLRLGSNHVQHVFGGERFEVEPVGSVVVGRHRLRIAVQHDGLVSRGTQRKTCVHAAIVELDALADAIRPATEDDDALLLRRAHLRLVFVRRIEIRRLGGKLCAARINRLVRRHDSDGFASRAHLRFVGVPQPRQLGITEAESLGASPRPLVERRQRSPGERVALFVDCLHLVQEPHVDARCLVDRLEVDAATDALPDLEDSLGRGRLRRREDLAVVQRSKVGFGRITVETRTTDLK